MAGLRSPLRNGPGWRPVTLGLRFLCVPFSAQMLELRKQESHNIGGNPMRFRTGEQTIRLDERWREQLSADDLAIFDRRAGTWNRRLGYST